MYDRIPLLILILLNVIDDNQEEKRRRCRLLSDWERTIRDMQITFASTTRSSVDRPYSSVRMEASVERTNKDTN